MSICSRSSVPLARCGLVWLGTGFALAALGRVGLPAALAGLRGPADFADLLVACSAACALLAGARLWLLTTTIALDVARRRTPCATGPLAALVLAACGLAVLGMAPAGATPRPVSPLDGLPLPDRAVGAAAVVRGADVPHPVPERSRSATVRVRPGDTLWSIAAGRLGPSATAARVAAYWPQIHAANAAVIGDDPDLIQPDQRLVLPPTDEESPWKR